MNTPSKHPVPAARRPLVRWPLWIVVAVALHAFVAGCGGSSPSSSEAPSGSGAASSSSDSPAQPPATESVAPADEAALGAQVYKARCALCHGAGGNGDGPAAAGLNPKPRAHTDKAYMSTLTDEQILAVIRNGKGTMPAWGKVLGEAELVAVAKHVRTLAK